MSEEQEKIERLEKTLGTLIVWLETTLGRNNVSELLKELHGEEG